MMFKTGSRDELENHKAWEPIVGRLNRPGPRYTGLFRFDYFGQGQWRLCVKKKWMPHHKPRWFAEIFGDVNTLSDFFRSQRKFSISWRSFWWPLTNHLGIRLSGSYDNRLKSLRHSLISLGSAKFPVETTKSGSNIFENVRAYAELGDNGGVDVWTRRTRLFSSQNIIISYGVDLTSLVEVESALHVAGIEECENRNQLLQLLSLSDF